MLTRRQVDGWPVLAYGFRPMFLACGLLALLAIPAWIWLRATQPDAWGAVPLQLWHAHEMLFGFALAAIAGFLSTAVPSWTGTPPAAGRPLLALALAWLAARLLLIVGPGASWWMAAIAELSVIPILMALIAPPLLRTRNRNRVLLAVLAGLWLADATFLWAVQHADVLLASRALLVTLDVALLMVTIVGGRIVPSFTATALQRNGVPAQLVVRAWIETPLPWLMAANAFVDAVAPAGALAAAIATVLALLHAGRMAGWQGRRTLREPILWSLHLAYAWLPLGYALKAVALAFGAAPGTFWLHAFGVGAVATMVLAVASRVSLGHTGRPLKVSVPMAWAYVLVTLAALARVILPHLGLLSYDAILIVAAALWSAAFLIFVVAYGPILTRPRIDARPG